MTARSTIALLALRRADRLHPPRLSAGLRLAASRLRAARRRERRQPGRSRRRRLADRRRLRRGGRDRGQGRQRARARLPARAARADRRLRRLRRRDRRAGPGRRRRPGPRPAARRQDRRPERRRRARLGRDPRLLRRQQRLGARRPAPPVEPFADPTVGYACGQVRFTDPEGDNLEGAYWRYEMAVREMESALAGVTAGNGAIYAVRARRLHPAAARPAATTSPSRSSSPSAGCARSTSPRRAAEEKMVPTMEGEFARKRRMMVGLWDIVVGEGMLAPARLPAALRLRARLPPAAPLPDPVAAPARLRRQPRPARAGLGLRRHLRPSSSALLAAALLGGRSPLAPFRIARYYVLTTASIAAGLWDRFRHGPPALGEGARGPGSRCRAPSTS